MILLGHNAHMIQIWSVGSVADPNYNITGTGEVIRWTGDAQAYLDEDFADIVKKDDQVAVVQGIIDLPANIPVWPNLEDYVRITRSNVLYGRNALDTSQADPTTFDYKVRKIDGGLLMLGKVRLNVVRS